MINENRNISDFPKPDESSHAKESPANQNPPSNPVNLEGLVNEMNKILNEFKTDPEKARKEMEQLHRKLKQEFKQ